MQHVWEILVNKSQNIGIKKTPQHTFSYDLHIIHIQTQEKAPLLFIVDIMLNHWNRSAPLFFFFFFCLQNFFDFLFTLAKQHFFIVLWRFISVCMYDSELTCMLIHSARFRSIAVPFWFLLYKIFITIDIEWSTQWWQVIVEILIEFSEWNWRCLKCFHNSTTPYSNYHSNKTRIKE